MPDKPGSNSPEVGFMPSAKAVPSTSMPPTLSADKSTENSSCLPEENPLPAPEAEPKKTYYMTIGMCIGMCLGLAFGITLMDSMPLGMCLGLAAGIAFGAAMDALAAKKQH